MTTINDLADGIKVRLDTVPGLRPYAQVEEQPHEPSAEVFFDSRARNDAGGGQVAVFSVDVSVSSDDRTWAKATRYLRTFLEPEGASSIEAAIYGDETLGGIADWSAVTAVEGERRVQWGDGYRIVGRVKVAVSYDP